MPKPEKKKSPTKTPEMRNTNANQEEIPMTPKVVRTESFVTWIREYPADLWMYIYESYLLIDQIYCDLFW